MGVYKLSTLWISDTTQILNIDDVINSYLITNLCGILGITPETEYTLTSDGMFAKRSEIGTASGLATLDTSSKVVQNPASASETPGASKIPIANSSGVLAGGWGSSTFPGSPLTVASTNSNGLLEHNRKITTSLSDGQYWGDIVTGTAGEALSVGEIVGLYSNGKFYKTLCSDYLSTSILGVVLSSATSGGSVSLLLRGFIGLSSVPGSPSLSPGTKLYVGPSSGGWWASPPTSGYLRVVGRCWSSGTVNILEFNPSQDWFLL